MLLQYLTISICFSLIIFSTAVDYCSICPNGSHTLCLYPEGPGPNCIDYYQVIFDEGLKQYIVDIHNDIRNHVASGQESKGHLGRQPTAANMMMMAWDDELASIAQRWADQCIEINNKNQHDICRKKGSFQHIGQNILTAVTNDTTLPELAILILNWYKQVSNVIPSDVEFFSGIKRGQYLIGHYTQLVWAKTKYVGCGLAIYKEIGNQYFDQRLVCNYAPGGNIIGQPIYETGVPCSKCPTNRRCDSFRTALCESPDIVEISNTRRKIINDWLGKTNNISVCIPDDGDISKTYFNDRNNFSNFEDRTNVEDREITDLLVLRNFSLTGNFDVNGTVFDTLPWVLNLMKYDNLSLLNNENYTRLMQTLKIALSSHRTSDLNNKLNGQPSEGGTIKKNRTKRAIGKWYNGHCHCDKVLRDGAVNSDLGPFQLPLLYVITTLVLIFF